MWDMDQAETAFFQTIVMGGLSPLAGERTTQALYHILQGRRANQTYQDVQIFRLYPYYRLFPSLPREKWQKTVEEFVQMNAIVLTKMSGNNPKITYTLTKEGEAKRVEGWQTYDLDKWLSPLQGSMQATELQEIWMRLHLLIQTVSHLIERNLHFFPQVGQKKIQNWVRQQLLDKPKRESWMIGLYDELSFLLGGLEPELQRILIGQWSGANKTGMTVQQIAIAEKIPPSFVQVKMLHALARMRQKIVGDCSRKFPLLSSLVKTEKGDADSNRTSMLSSSAEATLAMLEQGVGIQEIAATRQLKSNTIEDHLVEIALHVPRWDMSSYLQPTDLATIVEASRALNTRRLRMIKDHFGSKYSYLQIRLALTGRGGEKRDEP